ncbi:mannose-1-phosphate guanylyltransferase [Jiulongibacter sp. NS-SX5]|uniref:mannose-1-phosphate guanylyltransferase n=1 Tax=Jiulongibacter sp. NS-SX5 TaxID=3463854 RepID=UPI00405969D8
MNNNYVVIMAGGIGTRFWPFSRKNFPKQFHDVLGTGRTLIQQTADRFEGVCPKENIYVVTGHEYKELTQTQLPYLSDDQILCEPGRRNTAPCIGYACYKIQKQNPDANIVVAPADHIILKEEEFKKRINIAIDYASRNDALVTLGIEPSHPNTGYGYIQFEDEGSEVKKVKTFTEKPNLELAKMFLASGDYTWNAGIFVWSAASITMAFSRFMPEEADAFNSVQKHFYTESEKDELDSAYMRCRSISIDNGLMEKADNVYVVKSDIGWSDLGTWRSVYENSELNEDSNAIDGNVMTYNSTNCVVKTPKDKLVVLNGLDGFIVTEFNNVLMICKMEDEQKVKQFVNDAEEKGGEFV